MSRAIAHEFVSRAENGPAFSSRTAGHLKSGGTFGNAVTRRSRGRGAQSPVDRRRGDHIRRADRRSYSKGWVSMTPWYSVEPARTLDSPASSLSRCQKLAAFPPGPGWATVGTRWKGRSRHLPAVNAGAGSTLSRPALAIEAYRLAIQRRLLPGQTLASV